MTSEEMIQAGDELSGIEKYYHLLHIAKAQSSSLPIRWLHGYTPKMTPEELKVCKEELQVFEEIQSRGNGMIEDMLVRLEGQI
jgi:hypothetical protein